MFILGRLSLSPTYPVNFFASNLSVLIIFDILLHSNLTSVKEICFLNLNFTLILSSDYTLVSLYTPVFMYFYLISFDRFIEIVCKLLFTKCYLM
ncbi:hypothetical protein DS2_07603 [Catenovulum agarivorans DS-2]|uniref:Uncharacterized protein n=1 Tax=Catenovulum agarivorans DS-2 TaxID=1328313 RepID=W7QEX9_9ALTE|nr:hypothetical protein DS2_07603 [Catenovulum agarivorans DS-2]